MNRKSACLVTLLVFGLLATACNSHTDRPPDPQRLVKLGQPIYESYCASCHQTDGRGKPGQYPSLAGNPLVTLDDPIPVIKIVVNGKGQMPKFSDTLDNNQVAEVLSYIRNAWGNQSNAVSPRQIP